MSGKLFFLVPKQWNQNDLQNHQALKHQSRTKNIDKTQYDEHATFKITDREILRPRERDIT